MRRARTGRAALAVIALTAILAGLWFARTFTVRAVAGADDYLILGATQAQECEEGGGCMIFSTREFQRAVAFILMQQHRGGRL